MICGNWQGILLEYAYTAHSVTQVCVIQKKQKCIIMFIAFCHTKRVQSIPTVELTSLPNMTLSNITPNYFLLFEFGNIHIISYPTLVNWKGSLQKHSSGKKSEFI